MQCFEVKFSSVHPEPEEEQNEPDVLAATRGQVSKPFKETTLRAGPRHPSSCPQHCFPRLPHFGRDSNQKLRPLNSIGIYNSIFQVEHVTLKMLFFESWVPIQTSVFLKLVTLLQYIRKTISESLFLDRRNVGAVTLLEHWPCVCSKWGGHS